MPSVQAGLSGSGTLAEVFFGNFAVVARFMFFRLSQRDYVWAVWPFRVNHDNHVICQLTKADQAHFAIVLPSVFTRDVEMILNRIASVEVKPVQFDVPPALDLVPCKHCLLYIQNNIWSIISSDRVWRALNGASRDKKLQNGYFLNRQFRETCFNESTQNKTTIFSPPIPAAKPATRNVDHLFCGLLHPD